MCEETAQGNHPFVHGSPFARPRENRIGLLVRVRESHDAVVRRELRDGAETWEETLQRNFRFAALVHVRESHYVVFG